MKRDDRSSVEAYLIVDSKGSKKENVRVSLKYAAKIFVDELKKNWTTRGRYIIFTQKPIFGNPIFPNLEGPYPLHIWLSSDASMGEESEDIILKLTTQEHYELLYSALKGLAGKIPVVENIEE